MRELQTLYSIRASHHIEPPRSWGVLAQTYANVRGANLKFAERRKLKKKKQREWRKVLYVPRREFS